MVMAMLTVVLCGSETTVLDGNGAVNGDVVDGFDDDVLKICS